MRLFLPVINIENPRLAEVSHAEMGLTEAHRFGNLTRRDGSEGEVPAAISVQ